ncbi:PREDICTED: proteoglycan 4 [Trachymyrmex cornetzi]|uniref:proteoglycan 4 n=1 Tax=Trachymyrmex cornetzi TaxID=471704 RepID=UPI00084F15E1|nr:PREDICTED: proteoglycan 4 [Trachymyrmex cornetzi]
MATAGSNATASAGNETSGTSNVPQWKRDLIQRRRQQSKVLANNGASVKLCSAVIGTSSSATTPDGGGGGGGVVEQSAATEHHALRAARLTATNEDSTAAGSAALLSSPSYSTRRPPSGGATTAAGGATVAAVDFASPLPVAYNMRLEADLSLCSDAEDVVNGAPAKFADISSERKLSDYNMGEENEDATSRTADGKPLRARMNESNESNESSQRDEIRAVLTGRRDKEMFHGGNFRVLKSMLVAPPSRASSEEAESDSSEELQYGPGIVNKLKCKYLNLTLRETNKSRASVQRFRRAASLEDLLDRDDEESTRSVETLMRYNSVTVDEATTARQVLVTRPVTNGVRQEPVNDHIILVDRTSVKIESRLCELDRPKPINKPKRIKPVLAETERPPPDLVKTTMRIFESSARKLKPKGEVAAKVATFKTINDTFKAQTQTQKKLAQKPPLQPKPFINGGARSIGSPKKIVLPHKPTAELIETQDRKEEYHHIDGVITEPIAQSVSSVVSKFQQIEKSHSPSPSPEPSSYKLKFSPANSPEPPQTSKPKSATLEITIKSPPVTPVLSPRILSPRLPSSPSPVKDIRPGAQSPSSPIKDLIRIQIPSPFHKPPLPPSPVKGEPSKTEAESKVVRSQIEKEIPRTNVESPKQTRLPESSINVEWKEDAKSSRVAFNDGEKNVDEEIVDGPRTISKIALDNIGKAGTIMQFNFGDKPTSDKNYLPGTKQNGQKSTDEPMPEEDDCVKTECKSKVGAPSNVVTSKVSSRLQERLEPEEESDDKNIEEKLIVPENKPIGAICSLGLIKTATTTMTSPSATYSQSNNEAKTIRCQQKSEFSPPQKQIGIIRPLVSTKAQHPQQNLSNRELEKNLINRVKSIEQPTKVVVSLKSADEIQPAKKTSAGGGGGGEFNFSNRKDVPDYIENDGLIIRRKRDKPKVGDGGIIMLDATLDASTTDDAEWEISGGPPSPCDVSFLNDNVLINGRSNLSRTPRNHKHRIQFDDTATRTFEYPSEASILEGETSSVDGETSSSIVEQHSTPSNNKISSTPSSTTNMPSLLGGGGLASYTPSKVDLTSEGFELGITRAILMVPTPAAITTTTTTEQAENASEMGYLRPAQDAGAWGSETTGDLLY